jgi:hypothetical protein
LRYFKYQIWTNSICSISQQHAHVMYLSVKETVVE